MKKDRLLKGESSDQEDPTQAIFEAEYNFLLMQMKNPQVGSIKGKDKIPHEKKKRQLQLRTLLSLMIIMVVLNLSFKIDS